MSLLKCLERRTIYQVEAITKVKHGTDDKGLIAFGLATSGGPLVSADGIGLPEVDALAEPIPGVVAGFKVRLVAP
jgi:hypothetical protein